MIILYCDNVFFSIVQKVLQKILLPQAYFLLHKGYNKITWRGRERQIFEKFDSTQAFLHISTFVFTSILFICMCQNTWDFSLHGRFVTPHPLMPFQSYVIAWYVCHCLHLCSEHVLPRVTLSFFHAYIFAYKRPMQFPCHRLSTNWIPRCVWIQTFIFLE